MHLTVEWRERMKILLEAVLNRSNFVTFISIICILLFVLLQELEQRSQQGSAIQTFINTSFEVLYENQVVSLADEWHIHTGEFCGINKWFVL